MTAEQLPDSFKVEHRVDDPGPGRLGGAILTEPTQKDSLLGHYQSTGALGILRPHTAEQPNELSETQRASINHLFGLIDGTIMPTTDADWDIVEEHDQKLRAIMPPEDFVNVRHRPEQTKPRRSELSTIGQSDEFTASELNISPRVPAENSTRITIDRMVQLQYYLAGISGARGPQNEAERILLEEMAQEAEEYRKQSTRLSGLSGPSILLD